MALAVTHVIATIVLLDIFRHYVFGKGHFPRYLLVVGGIAGLLPDIDVPLTWLGNLFSEGTVNFHGVFTHSLIFPVIFLVLGIILYYLDNIKWARIFYVIAAGLFIHLLLDCLFGGYTTFFWPVNFPTAFCPEWGLKMYATGIDAMILVVWIVHEEIHEKVKDYI